MKSIEKLFEDQREPMRLLARVREELGRIPGVVGVGIGFRRAAGVMTEEITFRVLVAEKRPHARVAPSERIPREISGIPTDVERVPSGWFSLGGTLRGGLSINPSDADAHGTLGCFARLRSDPKVTVLLTNSHVIYGPKDDVTKDGRLVGQPDISSTWCCKTGVIGRAFRGKRPEPGGTSVVDAAIAKLNGKRGVDQRLPGIGKDENGKNEDLITGTPKPILSPANTDEDPSTPPVDVLTCVRVGEKVRKLGRSTGVTAGVVTDFGMPLSKPASETFPVERNYTEQIFIRPETGTSQFGQVGDSGAVVVNRFNQVVALLHASAPAAEGEFGGASQIHFVQDKLEIDVFPSPAAQLGMIPESVVTTNAIVPGSALYCRNMSPDEEARGDALDKVVEHLKESAGGRRVLELYDIHHREVRALLDHDRRVKIAWHRHHGPAFVAKLIAGLRELDQPIPQAIEGLSIEDGMRRVVEVFMQRGSDIMRADAQRYTPIALEVLAQSATIRDALERVRQRGFD